MTGASVEVVLKEEHDVIRMVNMSSDAVRREQCQGALAHSSEDSNKSHSYSFCISILVFEPFSLTLPFLQEIISNNVLVLG